MEFRLPFFQCQVAIDILDSVNYKQSKFGSVRGVDIMSAVQENLKWLKSEWNSFQGGANSKLVFQAWYEILVFFSNLQHYLVNIKVL